MSAYRLLSAALLALVCFLAPAPLTHADPTPPTAPAEASGDEPGVFVYIPSPALGAPDAPLGDHSTYLVETYATIDSTSPITITIDVDPRATLAGGLMISYTGGAGECRVFFERMTCRTTIKRWQPVLINVFVAMPDEPMCIPIGVTARAEGFGKSADVSRVRGVGGHTCIIAPLVLNGA